MFDINSSDSSGDELTIELQPSELITFLPWNLGDISVDAESWTIDIAVVLDPAFAPGDTTDPNCVGMSLTAFNATSWLLEPQTETACAPAIDMIVPRSIPHPVKLVSGEFFHGGEVIDYELRFANADPAHLPIAVPTMVGSPYLRRVHSARGRNQLDCTKFE